MFVLRYEFLDGSSDNKAFSRLADVIHIYRAARRICRSTHSMIDDDGEPKLLTACSLTGIEASGDADALRRVASGGGQTIERLQSNPPSNSGCVSNP